MWAAVFPGQGSQHAGMGKFLFDEFTVVHRCFEEAADAIGVNLKKLCFDGSEADLALTENTQPCLVLVSVATFRVLQSEFGFSPKMAAGHSVGEYSAMVAGQVIEFADAMRAVRTRGQAMQSAVPVGEGGMSAVMGLDAQQIQKLCTWAETSTGQSPVQAANLNAPGQIVISGRKSLLQYIEANFTPEHIQASGRVKFIPLKVSAPFHCAMMKPAEDEMRQVLADIPFANSQFPIVQNFTATPVTDATELRNNLINQVCGSIRWIECVEEIEKLGATEIVEVGCGRVLSGLVKKISGEKMKVDTLNSMEDLKAIARKLKE